MYDNLSHFLHHPAPDDSYASICTRCFATAGFGRTEEELVTAESKHVGHRCLLPATVDGHVAALAGLRARVARRAERRSCGAFLILSGGMEGPDQGGRCEE
jgi:hypothetical protein